MKLLLISILCSLLSLDAAGQLFDPTQWIGNYAGVMEINNTTTSGDQIVVDFGFKEVTKDSAWTYTMCYKSEKYGEILKDYRIIKPKNSTPDHFQIDELNGIVMDMTYMNNCFYQFFEVDGTIYSTVIKLVNDGIYFEIFGASSTPTTSSTYTPQIPEEETMIINSFRPTFTQSVLLKRIL